MPVPECLSAIKDIVLALSAATTAVVAVRGLHTWSRQLRGTASFETARALAKATYKLRDEIQTCRLPLVRAGEFPADYNKAGGAQPEAKANAYGHVFSNRWQPVYAAIQEFDTQTLEAEALWGEAIRSKTDELRQHVGTLNAAIAAYIDNELSANQDFISDAEFGKKVRSEVFASPGSQDNALSESIRRAVRSIENELKSHLSRG